MARKVAEERRAVERTCEDLQQRIEAEHNIEKKLLVPPDELKQIEMHWQQWCSEFGFAEDPEVANKELEKSEELRKRYREQQERQKQLIVLDKSIQNWEKRLSDLQKNIGIIPLAQLKETLKKCRENRAASKAADEELHRRQAEINIANQKMEEVKEAERKFKDDWNAWEQWRTLLGAPEDLSPQGVLEWLEAIDAAITSIEASQSAEMRKAEIEQALTSWTKQAAEVAVTLGESPPVDAAAACASVERWKGQIADAIRIRDQVLNYGRELKERQMDVSARYSDRAEQNSKLNNLLVTLGCFDLSNYDVLQARNQEREEAERRKQEARRTLQVSLGGRFEDPDVQAALTEGALEQWKTDIIEAVEEHKRLEQEKEGALSRAAELKAYIAEEEQATKIMELSSRISTLEMERQGLLRTLTRLRIARQLLSETFERFRKERQPEVLRRAGEWFAYATDGVYAGLEHSGDEATPGLVVLDKDGGRRPAEALSTGSAGLLYLCLRLALAVDVVARAEPLPMLLDDILVHFDPERARKAAEILMMASNNHQILLFSCQPTTVELLKEVAGEVKTLELSRFAGRAGPCGSVTKTASFTIRSKPVQQLHLLSIQERSHDDELNRLRAFFETHAGEKLKKQFILQETGIQETAWNQLISVLVKESWVEKQGERSTTTYLRNIPPLYCS